jgi:hypothetical protein
MIFIVINFLLSVCYLFPISNLQLILRILMLEEL